MAKTDRAIEQLEALHAELRAFRERPRPYAFINTVDVDQGHYVFRLHPNWSSGTASRWAVIVGEVVHNLRSALDHLVWECVKLSGGEPGRHNAFPLCSSEPGKGFKEWSTTGPVGGRRPGKLFGLNETAVSLIEEFQPYRGSEIGERLAQIDELWQVDKHRMPLPWS